MRQSNKIQTVKTKFELFKSALFYTFVVACLCIAFINLSSCSSDDSIAQDEPTVPEVVLIEPTITLLEGSEELTKGVIDAPGFGNMQHVVKAEAPEGFAQLKIYCPTAIGSTL